MVLGLAIETAGHEVVLAADGREGVKKYRAAPVDLIITDLFMPEREGLETIKELRKEFPEVKIIAMSGEHSAGTMLKIASKLGAAKILQKPFGVEKLLKAIEEVL
jgi:DNA-binding response OmpR family regulator